MRGRYLLYVALALVLAVALFAVACDEGEDTTTTAPTSTDSSEPTETTATETPTTAVNTEPIKIGIIASQTGPGAAPTPSMLNGVQVVVDAVNAAGGVNGRQIELITIDDKTDTNAAVAAFTKLATEDKVEAVLGPLASHTANAVRPLAEKQGIPLLRWDTPTLDAAPGDIKWSFICSNGPTDVADALRKQAEAAGWKNILAIGDSLPVNQQALELLKEAPPAGATVTLMSDTWGMEVTDLSPIVNKIMAEYNSVKPDVVFVMSTVHQTPSIQKGLVAMGVTVPIQNGPVSSHPAVFMMGPEAVEGMYVIGPAIMDATQLPEGYPGKEAMVKFSADLFAKFNEPATLFSAASADTINMLIEGLKAGGDDKEKVRATIEGLKDWQGLQGVFNYSPTNHEGLKGGYCEWQILDGKFMFVRALN